MNLRQALATVAEAIEASEAVFPEVDRLAARVAERRREAEERKRRAEYAAERKPDWSNAGFGRPVSDETPPFSGLRFAGRDDKGNPRFVPIRADESAA